jgi:Autoinducer binding domain
MTSLLASASLAPFRSYDEATKFLEETVVRAGIRHLSYWYLQYVDSAPDHVVWVSTYDPIYMSTYMKHFTPMGDAVINSVVDDNAVIDWVEWLDISQDIYREAQKFGITKYGISLPINSGGNDKIIFSVNVDCDDASWNVQRAVLVKRYRTFAQEFNVRMKQLIASNEIGAAIYVL